MFKSRLVTCCCRHSMEPRMLCYGSIQAVRESFLQPLWRRTKTHRGRWEQWMISRSQWWKWNRNKFLHGGALCCMSVCQSHQLTTCFRITWGGGVDCQSADSWALPQTYWIRLYISNKRLWRVFSSLKSGNPCLVIRKLTQSLALRWEF